MEPVIKKILETLGSKDVLFLENDQGLYHSDGEFEKVLIDHKVRYNALYRVGELPIEYVLAQVEWYDVIVFQTQWVYESSTNIKKAIMAHKFERNKMFIECVSGEPTFYRLPEGLPNEHEIYNFNNMACDYGSEFGLGDWEFIKLRKDKMPWED